MPYALQLAVRKLDASNELEKTIFSCAQHLNACYENRSPAKFQAEHLKINCRKFCTLLVALESSVNDSTKWHVKPKLHMFQELCETMDSCPSLTWTYRDEDAGGGIMQVGRRRGGSNNCWATGQNMLDKLERRTAFQYCSQQKKYAAHCFYLVVGFMFDFSGPPIYGMSCARTCLLISLEP